MKYHDGQEVNLHDKVALGADKNGMVVCIIESNEYSNGYEKEQWGYLKKGVMVNFPLYGLIYYDKPEQDLKLVRRNSPNA